MTVRTFGVAIAVPEPFGSELQRKREQLGDPMAKAIPAHVTLVPPTDIVEQQLARVDAHLAAVAGRQRPFEIQLHGTGSFRPVSPVVFVALAAGISGCERLEKVVRSGPLARPLKFNYHPHVTVAHDLAADVLDRAFVELADFKARFDVTGYSLFERDAAGVWHPERDYLFDSLR